MLSKSHGAMHCHDAGSEVVQLHGTKARGFEHALQRGLVRMHADRFGQVAIGLAGADHPFTEPGQHAEGVKVVERLERRPYMRELEYDEPSAELEYARHLGNRPFLVR